MNYAACLSTVCCSACAAECHLGELHATHIDLCSVCGDDLQATIDTDAAEALLDDDQIVAVLLETEPSEVIEAAERARQFLALGVEAAE